MCADQSFSNAVMPGKTRAGLEGAQEPNARTRPATGREIGAEASIAPESLAIRFVTRLNSVVFYAVRRSWRSGSLRDDSETSATASSPPKLFVTLRCSAGAHVRSLRPGSTMPPAS
jgi:hypothetical protein